MVVFCFPLLFKKIEKAYINKYTYLIFFINVIYLSSLLEMFRTAAAYSTQRGRVMMTDDWSSFKMNCLVLV